MGPRPVVDELLEERGREQGRAPPDPVVLQDVGDLAPGANRLAGLVRDGQPPQELPARVGRRGDRRGRLVVAEDTGDRLAQGDDAGTGQSVFVTSTVVPSNIVRTSPGRIAVPDGMFSAIGA